MFSGRKQDPLGEWLRAGGTEHRRFPRLPLKTLARVRFQRATSHCRLRDLSLGGLSLIAPFPVRVGEALAIELDAPDGTTVPRVGLEGAVVSSAPRAPGEAEHVVHVRFQPGQDWARRALLAWFEAFGEEAEYGAGPPKPRASRRGGPGEAR